MRRAPRKRPPDNSLWAAVLIRRAVCVSVADGAFQENIYASGCSDDEVTLQCPENHRIAIKRLFYGVKRSWDCQEVSGAHRPGTRRLRCRRCQSKSKHTRGSNERYLIRTRQNKVNMFRTFSLSV